MKKLLSMVVCAAATAYAVAQEPANRLVIHADRPGAKIDRNIYGHFSEHLGHCIYEGFWVGEDSPIPNTRGIRNDLVAALKAIRIPVLRWPGGCFADEYHWMDGIGPRETRPSMINTHWGGVTESNAFGTHEFMDLCEQLDCEPYICGNLGSGSVQEMQQWVEYITSDAISPMTNLRKQNGREAPWKLTYFGVGNENWGCGGNMSPEFYADQYKRYATYVRNFGSNRVYKIACGPNGANTNWTEVLMREAGKKIQGLALHYYCGTGKKSRSATDFTEIDWIHQLKGALHLEELIVQHAAIMDKFDEQRKVALIIDEWGAWHAVEPGTNPGFLYQQNSLRDALVAAVSLNSFNRHADRVRMANIAQTINVLQAMALTEGEKMALTPTYHVFEMYVPHHDATLMPVDLTCADYRFEDYAIPSLDASASRAKDGSITLTLAHMNPNTAAELAVEIAGAKVAGVKGRILTGDAINAHNTFDQPARVKPAPFDGASAADGKLTVTLPPKSVVVLTLTP
jgi:alpha-L-arabinofuranosidase